MFKPKPPGAWPRGATARKSAQLFCLLSVVAILVANTAAALRDVPSGAPEDVILYNGIRLPSVWPPQVQSLTLEPPPPPPYLVTPPDVIPIDVGRQLFVDDFLIEQTSLRRRFHVAAYHSANPVLKPDKPWEHEGDPQSPTAMLFSDGVWYDPSDHLFKMWYMCGMGRATCYATSPDGIHWHKPSLDVRPGTNIVHTGRRDSSTVWLDLEEKDRQRRYKMVRSIGNVKDGLQIHVSPDGIHWSDTVAHTGPCGDRTTGFWNPFRKVWVFSIRNHYQSGGAEVVTRERRYWETPQLIGRATWEDPDPTGGAKWRPGEATLWVGADTLDPPRPEHTATSQLYNLDAVAYESLLLGLLSIWRGQPQDRPKINEVVLGFSRDGFHWYRPDRRPFISVSEWRGDWNWGNVQSAAGGCLVVGDKLYFYVSGRAGVPGSSKSGVSSTGMATLRRDGFASMDAIDTEGMLMTRPVRFRGKYLFVNADARAGEVRVEILDGNNHVIPSLSRGRCIPLHADKTLQIVRWKDVNSLQKLAGKPVKFRFYLKNARLFAFWVSPRRSGASHGYVAAGGPGFTGPTDTVGSTERRQIWGK